MDVRPTLDQWHHALHIFHRAHSRAATYFEQKNILLGLPAVMLTTAAGTTVFATIGSSTELWAKILTGIMSIAAALLAALQTFLKYSERAERHKTAAQNYGMLRRLLEETMLEAEKGSKALPDGFLKSFREQWDNTDKQAPNLPQRIYDEVEQQVKGGR